MTAARLLVVTSFLLLASAQGAMGYDFGAVTPATPGTTQTTVDGVTVTATATGATSMSAPAEALSARGAVNANFTPSLASGTIAFRPLVSVATCPSPTTVGTSTTCSGLGTMTFSFSRPVRNPTLHLAGLGGALTSGASTVRFHATGTIQSSTPAGATLTGPLTGATNLTVSSTAFRATQDNLNTSCATAGSALATAGCGSVSVNGTISSITFAIGARLVASGGLVNLSSGTPADAFAATFSAGQDYGDAPASYEQSSAAAHTLSDLTLGSTVDEDAPTTANPTTSPNSVAGGANASGTNGDGTDEDALPTWPTLTTANAGGSYSVTVPVSGLSAAARLCGWIDFNRNGTFDAGERACASPGPGATSATLTWSVPTATAAGSLYARLRLGYQQTQVDNPTGPADSGEVEDYSIAMFPRVVVQKAKTGGGGDTFDLRVNGTTFATAVGNGGTTPGVTAFHSSSFGSTPSITVTPNIATAAVPLTISEVASSGNQYAFTSTYACVNGSGTTVTTGSGTSGSITLPQSTGTNAAAQNLTCTFTNTQRPAALTLDKTATSINDLDGNGPDVGDQITYAFSVTNSGGAPLSTVAVADPTLAGASPAITITCAATSLALGASTTCTASGPYRLTQADVDAGAVNNTATATARDPNNATVSSTDATSTAISASPSLELTKSVGAVNDLDANGTDAGDTLAYTLAVKNTGNVSLTSVTVNDPLLGGAVACPVGGPLAPGQTVTCPVRTYTLTQADIDAGSRANTATATAVAPSGASVNTTASTTAPLTRAPSLLVDKTAGTVNDVDGNGTDPGDTITYGFSLRNTGNVTLTAAAITDPRFGTPVTCPGASPLAPGQTVTCPAKIYTLTQADVDAGAVNNTATATATDPTNATVTSVDSTSTALTATPSIVVDKTASAVNDLDGNGTDAGDTIAYGFSVRNTGNVTLSAVAVSDPLFGGAVSCPGASPLAPGQSVACPGRTYTLTQADVDAGTRTNTATVSASTPTGGTVSGTDSTSTTLTAAPSIVLDKTAGTVNDLDGNGTDAGDTITYGFAVQNTGNVTLTAVAVNDPLFGGAIACPGASPLAPGATFACPSRTLVLTQADVDAGAVNNTATASAQDPSNTTVTGTDATSSSLTRSGAIVITKTAGAVSDLDGNGVDAGDTISYGLSVQNTGNVTLSSVAVSDPLVGGAVACPGAATLAPGQTVACPSRTYTLTQADLDAGTRSNTATVTANPPAGAPVTDTDATTTALPRAASIQLDKTAGSVTDVDGNGFDVGDTITYGFAVRNTGNVTLTGGALNDPLFGGAMACAGLSPLAPGAIFTCPSRTYTLTQADVDAGAVNNTATVTATDPTNATVNGNDSTSTAISRAPSITIDKTASAVNDLDGNGTDAGDTIVYDFSVRNAGNVTLNPVTISDPKLGGTVSCPGLSPLAPGVTFTCPSVTYTILQADIDGAAVVNNATVIGTSPSGSTAAAADSTVTGTQPIAAIQVDKSAGPVVDLDGNGVDAGDTVTYGFAVVNVGNVNLTGVTVSDPLVGGTIACPAASTLTPGQSVTCPSRTYTLTQADLDAGVRTNTATASANSVAGPISDTDSTLTRLDPAPSISLDKTASSVTDTDSNGTDAGDTIAYDFAVTNTGNVTLTSVAVSDPLFSTAVVCPGASPLTPGTTVTCTTKTYTLTQADLDAGAVNNTATTSGNAPSGATVTATDSTSTTLAQTSALVLDKTASAVSDLDANGVDAGDRITYDFSVRNAGNVTLTSAAISDPLFGGAITCPALSALAPGQTVNCPSANYTLSQTDVDAGTRVNTATATARDTANATLTATDSTATTLPAAPSIQVTKTAGAVTDVDANGTDAGDTIVYGFSVRNTGNVTLGSVALSDPLFGGTVSCPGSSTLAPSQTVACPSATYTLTQADLDAGTRGNTITASATAPNGASVTDTDATTTPLAPAPSIAIDKTASSVTDTDGNGVDAGDTISYGFTVDNTGNVTLSSVAISDAVLGGPVSCPGLSPLSPGTSFSCPASVYTLTQADIDAGARNNSATVTSRDPSNTTVSANDATSTTLTRSASILVTKTASTVDDLDRNGPDAGDTITYGFAVTNTGNVTLSSVAVSDPLVGGAVSCPGVSPLAPSQRVACPDATYTLTQADIDAGARPNTATVTSRDPANATVTDSDTTTTSLPASPSITLDKTASGVTDTDGNGVDAGDTIGYGFTVTNTGNVTLSAVAITDARLGGTVTCAGLSPLAPGASVTCTPTTSVLTQNDVDAGAVNNTASVTGRDPSNVSVSAVDTTSTALARSASIAVDKTAGTVTDIDGNGTDAGDTISYAFSVTNTGNVTLTAVAITDPLVGGAVSCPGASPLAPGQTVTCPARTYVLTQSDVDAGSRANTATVAAQEPTGTTVSGTDTTLTTLAASPSLDLSKSAGAVTDVDGNGTDAGDTITYTFSLRNTGNVTLTNVAVNDPLFGGTVSCPAAATLTPGQSIACPTRTYTLTQADVDAGSRSNTATASSTDPNGTSAADTASVTTALTPSSSMALDKSAGPINDVDGNGPDAGDTITYLLVIANTGATTLSSVGVTDGKLGAVTCSPTTLAPGASVACTAAAYVLTQDDIDGGAVNNTAFASSRAPGGVSLSERDSTSTAISSGPGLALDKTAGAPQDLDGNGVDAGDRITYGFTVANIGNVTISAISLADPLLGPIGCPRAALAPGSSMTCTATNYSITQSDVDSGLRTNTATVTGTAPDGSSVQRSDAVTATITRSPNLTVDKTASDIVDLDSNGQDVGDRITYGFTVANVGNVSLSALSVTDPLLGTVTCPQTTMLPGTSQVCTAIDYTLTQADVDAGARNNEVRAAAVDPAGATIEAFDATSTPITAGPAIALAKSAGPIVDLDGNGQDAGDTIAYAFLVTNTGTVTLTSITLSDPQVSAISCPATPLAPGNTVSCTASAHTLTSLEIDAGEVRNTATVSGTAPSGRTVTGSDSTKTTIFQRPMLALDKHVVTLRDLDGNGQDAGDEIDYEIVATNQGNVSLTGVTIDDPKLPALACTPTQPATLGAGDSLTCSGTLTIVQGDIDSGSLTNAASASGQSPAGVLISVNASVTTPLSVGPSVILDKTASAVRDLDGNGVDAGDEIDYTFTASNTGNVTLSDATISDPLLPSATCPATAFAPGTELVCGPFTYTLTQADIDAGWRTNTAEVSAQPPLPAPAVTGTDSTATPLVRTPALSLDKIAGPIQDLDGNGPDAGDRIDYTFTIRNIGNTSVSGVGIADAQVGTVTCTPTTLAPSQTAACAPSSSYTLTQTDVDNGAVNNTATVTGTAPSGAVPSTPDASDSTSTPVAPTERMVLTKTASAVTDTDGNGTDVGDTITYGFTLQNTGNVSLRSISVDDAVLGPVTCPTPAAPGLAPGATLTCTDITYTLAQSDVDGGQRRNAVRATAEAPSGTTISSDAEVVRSITRSPSLLLDKVAGALIDVDGNGPDIGDRVPFTFSITNSGNVTLTEIALVDPRTGALTCPSTNLVPTATMICDAGSSTVTQDDLDAGALQNTASVTAKTPTDAILFTDDSTSTSIPARADLVLTKTASAVRDLDGNGVDAGDAIDYGFTVENTGQVTLAPVTVADPLLGGDVPCPAATVVAPGSRVTCPSGTYTLTQGDLDAGSRANQAVASGRTPGGSTVVASADTTTTLAQRPGLVIDLTVDPPAARPDGSGDRPGDLVTYRYTVQNTGNTALSEVGVIDPEFGRLRCTPSTLAPGQSAICEPRDHALTADEIANGLLSHAATATANAPNGLTVNTANDEVSVPLQAVAPTPAPTPTPVGTAPAPSPTPAATPPSPFLRLKKVADKSRVKAGGKVRYTLTIENTGTAAAMGVELCDRLPSRITLVGRPNASVRNGLVCWTFDLPAKASRTFSISVRVDRNAPTGKMTNRAQASAGGVPVARDAAVVRARAVVQVKSIPPRPISRVVVTG